MAGGVRDTEATFDVAVNGIGKLQELNNAFDKTLSAAKKVDDILSRGLNMNGGSGSAIRFSENISKGASSAEKLNTSLGRAVSLQRDFVTASGRSESAVTKVASAYDKAVISSEKVAQAQSRSAEMSARAQTAEARHAEMVAKVATAKSRATEASVRAASAQDRETSALARSVAQADKLASARQKDLALAEKYNAQTNAINNAAARSSMLASGGKKESRIGGAVKDGLAMFGPSMLIAGGIMSAAGGIRNLFGGGYEMLKQRQSGQAMWATSVSDAHNGVTGSNLTKQSVAANNAIMATALKAGNDYSEANAIAKQIYSSDGGKYSGNVKNTNSLLKGMFNIQDANALSTGEMHQFRTAVGNIGDLGKMSGMSAKSLNLLDGKMTRAIRSEYKKETGHALGLNKTGTGYDWGSVSAALAFKALDKYGNGTGVGQASERFNATLPGMLRAGKSASSFLISEVMDQFGKGIGKGGGFSDLIKKLSGKFTDFDSIKGAANKAGSVLTNSANKIGSGILAISEATKVTWQKLKPFRTGFADGFVDEMKNIKGAVVDGAKWIGGAYNKLKSMLPKGSDKDLESFGKNVGKVAAFMLALKGASKLPVIGKVFDGMLGKIGGLLGKIPVVGGILQKLIGGGTKNTAAAQMLTASDRMLAAANKMNGGSGGSGGAGGYTNGRVVSGNGKLTASERLANSGFGAAVDKTFLKGTALSAKGGLSGLLGKLLVGGSTGAAKLSLGGAGLATAIGSSKLGSILGGVGRVGKGVLSRGGGLINAAFAGFDVYNAMKNNKAGTKARHVGVGSAIGGGVGGTLGAALGSFLGPLGTIGGGMAGSWLGGKVGGWVGSKFPTGSKKKSTKKTPTFNKKTIGPSTSALKGSKSNADNPLLKSLNEAKKKSKSTHSSIKSDSKKTASSQKKDSASVLANAKKNNNALLAGSKKLNSSEAKLSKKSAAEIKKASEASSKGQKKAAEAAAKASVAAQKKAAKSTLSSMKKQGSDLQKALKKQSSGQKKELSAMKKNQKSSLKSMNKDAQSSFKKFSKLVSSTMKKAKSSMKSGMKSMSNASKSGIKPIQNQFKKLNSSIKSSLNKAKSTAKSGTKGVVNAIKSGFKGVGTAGKSAFNKLPSSMKSGFNKARSVARSGAKGIVTSVKGGLKSMNSAAKSSMNGFTSSIKSSMSKATSAARSGSSKLVSSVKSGLSKVGTAATSSMGKLTTSITSGMSKATSAAKSGADKIATSLSNGFKKAVTAANSSTSKIAASMNKIGSSASSATSKVQALASAINGLKSKTVTITANVKGKGADKLEKGTSGALGAFNAIPHYAGGTGAGHAGGMALVNDAKGSNYREAFMLPNGMVGLFPKKRNFMTYLPKGTHVLNANDTRKKFGAGVARYANGTSNALKAVNDMQNRSLSSHSGSKQTKSANVTVNITLNVQNAGNGATDDIMKNLGPAVKAQIEEVLRSFNQKESEVIA